MLNSNYWSQLSKSFSKGSRFLALIILAAALIAGCEQKRDDLEEIDETPVITDTAAYTDTAAVDTAAADSAAADSAAAKQAGTDLTGTWSGKFDSRNTTLNITSQEGNDFSGRITINYREVINQEVKGKINPENNTFTMTDQLHSRYQGSYSGNLSEDGKKMSGTFTMKRDGSKLNFNLSKK